jgi:hypothetical protein
MLRATALTGDNKMKRIHVSVSCTTILLFSTAAFLTAQNKVPVSDPQAVSYAKQAIQALTLGTSVSDVTVNGNVSSISSTGTERGTATLNGKGLGESRVDLFLGRGTKTEVRNGTSGVPLGNWYGTDGLVHEYATQNSWTDAVWFFPALSSLTTPPGANIVLSYIGQETRGGIQVQHIQSYVYAFGQDPLTISHVQSMSGMDFYLDNSSFLPVAVVFNAHPDNDSNTNLALEIDFSDYRSVNGFQIPYRIQKLFQGTLQIDFTTTSAVVNPGLSDSIFAIK